MVKLLFIAAGGAVGAVLRYAVGSGVQRLSGGAFPWGTLSVNLIGSFAIGVLWAFCDQRTVPPNVRLLLLTGLLGAFTTFSTFSLETMHLIQDRQYTPAVANVAVSCLAGVVLVFCGFLATRWILGGVR